MATFTTFSVHYRITANDPCEAERRADTIALEQTAEMPFETIPGRLRGLFAGEAVSVERLDERWYEAVIRYPLTVAGNELHQCLNILFGNSSLQPGIKLTGIQWEALTDIFPGPAHGVEGLRKRLGISGRPLSCSALKPIGLSVEELTGRYYELACGGMDLIKDDHGLANQPSAPFKDRLRACIEAANRAGDHTGKRTAYFPNITGDGQQTWRRYEQAKRAGADGVLLSPQLTGWGVMKSLIEMGDSLPIMVHPSFTGSFIQNPDHGFSIDFFYGSLWRALGADAVVYPNTGGRFSFSDADCTGINQNLRTDDSPFRTSFPVPGGGIQRDSIDEWTRRYGPDTIFLVGGSLYQHPDGLQAAAREFQMQLMRYNTDD